MTPTPSLPFPSGVAQDALRLDRAVQESAVGIAVLDAQGTVLDANRAFCEFLGIASCADAGGVDLPSQVRRFCVELPNDLPAALSADSPATFRVRTRAGNPLILHSGARGDAGRLVIVDSAMPSRHPWPAGELPGYQDPLTGLGNRLLLDETIARWTEHRESRIPAVLMIDLDRFKQVNDTLGHDVGDRLLVLAAKRLRAALREQDTVVRMGGDEFVIAHLSAEQPSGSELVARRVLDLLGRPFLVDGHQVNVGASIGIALCTGGVEPSDLLKQADLALYEAKAAGRGVHRFFEPALAQRAHERRTLEVHLRRALGLRQFSLQYQPQLDIESAGISGFEALLRWEHPERGLVMPAHFIPMAEDTGEIKAIGAWVMKTACRDAVGWPGDYKVAVNVSPVQFESDDIVEVVHRALALSGLPAHRLELEITEGVLLTNPDDALRHLHAIRDLGVQIAMDDFGTGYSSLSYLHRFPFSKIKIDQSFIRAEQTAKSRALIKAILGVGSSLGMKTIAEGVETQEQYRALAENGCAEAQGYLIGRPLPPAGVAAFLAAPPRPLDTTGT